MKRRIAILISGRGSNMEAIIRQARGGPLSHCCDPVVVVSNRSGARGLLVARALGVETKVLPSKGVDRDRYDQALCSLLEPYDLDYLVLAGFMRILGWSVIARYRDRIVNIHPADPRQFRGIGGYRWAWERGLKSTMVTVHLVDEGVDTGRILAQAEVSLEGIESHAQLEERGLAVEHALYGRVLRGLFENGEPEGAAPATALRGQHGCA